MADLLREWMWSEACEMLARAERLHRAFIRPARSTAPAAMPVWEPPADVLETEREVVVLIALPGVEAEHTEIVIDEGELVIGGVRVLPPALRQAFIHRLELPQGRFERRLLLPPGKYSEVRRTMAAGYLVITLQKAETDRG